MTMANTLADCDMTAVTAVKSFILMDTGVTVIKLFTAVIYNGRNKLLFVISYSVGPWQAFLFWHNLCE